VQISQNVGWDDVDYSNPNWIDSEAKNVREMYFGDLRRGSSFTIIRSAVTGNESFVSTGGWIDASVLESASAVIIGDIEYSLNIDMKYNSFNVPNEAFGSFNRAGSSNGYMNHGGAASISTEYSLVAQGGGGFDDFTQKWDNANSTYGAPFNIAVGLVSEAAKQSATISTAQAFARRELSATLQFAKVAKYAGTASLIGNASQVLNAGYKFYQDPSLGNFTRVGVQFGIIGIEAGLNILLPGSGIMVGIGLNILESQYGDNLYNTIDGR